MTDLPSLSTLLDRYHISAKKEYGQNFILDMNIMRRIVHYAGDVSACDIIEIGAGPGGLTRAMLEAGARQVYIVEKDDQFLPLYHYITNIYKNKLNVISDDILTLSPDHITPHPYKIIANLPYNIATPLIVSWLSMPWPPRWVSLTLMFQEEVAQRLTASVNSAAYGRLAVLAGWRTNAEIVMNLPAHIFTPAPKVDSALVHFTPRPSPLAPAKIDILTKITKAAFGQKRKMLRSALKQICVSPHMLLETAQIDETKRAENVTIEEFCALARVYDTQDHRN